MVEWKSVYAVAVEISVCWEARKRAGKKNTAIVYSRPKPMVTKWGMRICKRKGTFLLFSVRISNKLTS